MAHDSKVQTLAGRLQQILFSPKGGLEGLLIEVRGKTTQISMTPGAVDAAVLDEAVGKPIEATVQPDHSSKTKHGAHPVYQLRSITKIGGSLYKPTDDKDVAIRGVVSAIHYAKHGEPNGVILETGEFVHTRPGGMRKLNLTVGSKVVVRGETRMTVLRTAMIEAREVNRVTLE